MKKLYILSILLLLSCSAYSQHYVGVRGGYGVSDVSFTPYKETQAVSGVDRGLAYKYYADMSAFFIKWGTQVELNYIHKGYIGVDTTHNAMAIELPAMTQAYVKFNVGRLGTGRIFVNGGLYGAYTTKGEITYKNQQNIEHTEPYKFQDRDNRFEYGLIGGGGLAFGFGKLELQGEVRYQYGMSFLMQPRYEGAATCFAHRNHMAFSFSIFYKIGSLK